MRRQRWFAVLAVSSINAGLLIGGGFAMNHFEAANEAVSVIDLSSDAWAILCLAYES